MFERLGGRNLKSEELEKTSKNYIYGFSRSSLDRIKQYDLNEINVRYEKRLADQWEIDEENIGKELNLKDK